MVTDLNQRQLMLAKARAAASLVWNHKEMGREDEETELEQYLEERRERGRQKREKFADLFLRSLRFHRTLHWWRYSSASNTATIPLCLLLLALSLFRSLSLQIWPNWALLALLLSHGPAALALCTRCAGAVPLLIPLAVVYTLCSVLGFALLLFSLPWLAFGHPDPPKIPPPVLLALVPLLPLLAWTSKSLWEAILVLKWREKWRKSAEKQGEEFRHSAEERPQWPEDMQEKESKLIARAKAKRKDKDRVLLFRRGRGIVVHFPVIGGAKPGPAPEPPIRQTSAAADGDPLRDIYARFVRPEQCPREGEVLVYTERGFVRKRCNDEPDQQVFTPYGPETGQQHKHNSLEVVNWPDLLTHRELVPTPDTAVAPPIPMRRLVTEV